jgi:hypothetical protein
MRPGTELLDALPDDAAGPDDQHSEAREAGLCCLAPGGHCPDLGTADGRDRPQLVVPGDAESVCDDADLLAVLGNGARVPAPAGPALVACQGHSDQRQPGDLADHAGV